MSWPPPHPPCRFASIARLAGEQLGPKLATIIPRLYRYLYDPNGKVNTNSATAHVVRSMQHATLCLAHAACRPASCTRENASARCVQGCHGRPALAASPELATWTNATAPVCPPVCRCGTRWPTFGMRCWTTPKQPSPSILTVRRDMCVHSWEGNHRNLVVTCKGAVLRACSALPAHNIHRPAATHLCCSHHACAAGRHGRRAVARA